MRSSAKSLLLLITLVIACLALQEPAFADVCTPALNNNNPCPGAPVMGFVPPGHYLENVLYTFPAGVTVVPGDVVMCEDGSGNLACFNAVDPNTGLPRGSDVVHFTANTLEIFADPLDAFGGGVDIPFCTTPGNPPGIGGNCLPGAGNKGNLSANAFAANEAGAEGFIQFTIYDAFNAAGQQNNYDLISDTPEPSSLFLMASGLAAAAAMVRRRSLSQ